MTGGTAEMSDTRYRSEHSYVADMAHYIRNTAGDNSDQMGRIKKNLVRAMNEDITPRQREYLRLYYGSGINMREIGDRFGVDTSTVSRTIKRGERRLRRCLRYGAKHFLQEEEED